MTATHTNAVRYPEGGGKLKLEDVDSSRLLLPAFLSLSPLLLHSGLGHSHCQFIAVTTPRQSSTGTRSSINADCASLLCSQVSPNCNILRYFSRRSPIATCLKELSG